jgi:hypothetical protein
LNPLTIQLSSSQQLILSSHNAQSFDLDESSFIFSSNFLQENSQRTTVSSSVNMSALSAAIAISFLIFVFVGFVCWYQSKTHNQKSFLALSKERSVIDLPLTVMKNSLKKNIIQVDSEENNMVFECNSSNPSLVQLKDQHNLPEVNQLVSNYHRGPPVDEEDIDDLFSLVSISGEFSDFSSDFSISDLTSEDLGKDT